MSYDTLQWLIIAIAVTASGIYAAQKLAPKALRSSRTQLALILLRPQRSPNLRTLGRWLAPKPIASAACGTGACNSCAPAE